MSLLYITFHDENIHDIERPASAKENIKFPKYVSVHRKIVQSAPLNQIDHQGKKIISASTKYSHKTLGYPETRLDSPSKFLMKNGGIKWQRLNDHVCPPIRGLPPIPKKQEKYEKIRLNETNFIKKNMKHINSSIPQRLTPKYVDSVVGERHNLYGTGLTLQHVLSEKYGKCPNYLKSIKKAIEQNMCCKFTEPKDNSKSVQVLTNPDRNAILMGLRNNHSELEKTYQLLSIFTDTQSKKQRKAKLEQELKIIEQDILLMESNPVILVCED